MTDGCSIVFLNEVSYQGGFMKKIIALLIVSCFFSSVCEARIFGRRNTGSSYSSSSDVDTSCAQGIANGMAKRKWVGHFGLGGTGLMEGCASGATKEYAYNHCCFANDRSLKTVDVGYAQDNNGTWYCCRRYKR